MSAPASSAAAIVAAVDRPQILMRKGGLTAFMTGKRLPFLARPVNFGDVPKLGQLDRSCRLCDGQKMKLSPLSVDPQDAPWDADFCEKFAQLLAWRRDVRHFRGDPVPPALLTQLIELACLSPSVGNAQPWRFVLVEAPARRAAIIANFEACNADALAACEPARQESYAALKLAGLREAPVHLAVFCEEAPEDGHGLGRQTMPEMLRYSVVCAVHALWLAARCQGLGVGWVSILDPQRVGATLERPDSQILVAYLCIGWPMDDHLTPELQRRGWQHRHPTQRFLTRL